MKRLIPALVAITLAPAAFADWTPAVINPLSPSPAAHGRLFGGAGVIPAGGAVIGDSYSIGVLGQSSSAAYYISDMSPSTHLFDGGAESGGRNLTGSIDGSFTIIESMVDLANGNRLIQVEVTALDAQGLAAPWIASGAVSPSGPFTSWRLDVGDFAGGHDGIDPQMDADFTVVDSGFSAFDSAGVSVGGFDLTEDTSDATALSGLAILGLGGADVAGYDVSSIQMYWEVAAVPTPGAMALLGLAGIMGKGRRRRA